MNDPVCDRLGSHKWPHGQDVHPGEQEEQQVEDKAPRCRSRGTAALESHQHFVGRSAAQNLAACNEVLGGLVAMVFVDVASAIILGWALLRCTP